MVTSPRPTAMPARSASRPASPSANLSVYQLKVTLQGVRPAVWRRVLVPASFTLHQLHQVIQQAMGWTDSHLHRFVVDGRAYSLPEFGLDAYEGDPKVHDERRVRLDSVVAGPGDRLAYEYDFGDDWRHGIVVENVLTASELKPFAGMEPPVCIGGQRACPPEDCGGVSGYSELLEAIADPRHEEHVSMRQWLGGAFDPRALDLVEVNQNIKAGDVVSPEPSADQATASSQDE